MSEHSITKTSTKPEGFTVVDTASSALAKHNEDSSTIPRKSTTEVGNNCIETTNECGDASSVSPAYSSSSFVDSANDEEDSKSCCSSGKDSGVGKSVLESADIKAISNRKNSEEHNNFVTSSNSSSVQETSATGGGSPSQVELDSSFLWGASLFYYTGVPAPRIKEQHFITSPSPSPPPLPKANSSFASTFSLFRSRSTTKLFRSTLSLRSSEDNAGMDEQRKSPWRFRGNSKKFNTLPIKTSSPVALESPFGTIGSSMTMTTPDSGFLSGTGGENSGGDMLTSPLRRRHASCSSTTPTSSTGAVSGGLRDRIKNNTNSLRLFKNVTTRPSLSQFLDKSSSNSLPRSPRRNRICEEIAAQQQVEGLNSPVSPVSDQKVSSGSGSSGLKSAKRALRNSFKAARNLLPGSSSKIGPAAASGKASLKSSRDKLCMFPSSFNDNQATLSAQNSSAPNTPVTVKKSRLERAKKRFASTLSLHTGGGGSSSSGSTAGTYPGGRSKSVSTLVVSDSEIVSGGIPTGVVSYTHHHQPHSQRASSFEESCDVLAVVEGDRSTSGNVEMVPSGNKSKGEGSKSPFRFIGKYKANREKKSDTSTLGFHAKHDPQKEEIEWGENVMIIPKEQSSPQANIELLPKSVQEKVSTTEADEKPSKKRMSLVKSIVSKTILRGGSSGGASIKKGHDDGNKQELSQNETVMFYKTATGGTLTDSEGRKTRRGIREQSSQEIVTFDNEPRVRTPKAGRRQRLNSGSGTSGSTASSSVTYTPPRSATEPVASTPEKDREIHELVVSETSIDITPVKSLKQPKQHYLPLSHYDTNNSNNPDSYNDYDEVAVTNPVSRESTGNSNPLASSSTNIQKKPSKKTKSQRLITSLVSLSPSSSFSAGKTMEDGTSSKKKKKGFKKASKKLQEEKATSTQAQQQANQSSSSFPVKGEHSGESMAAQSSNNANITTIDNNNDDPIPSAARRRKSSEDYKDLRKNAMRTNGIPFVDQENQVVSGENCGADKMERDKRESKERDEYEAVSGDNNEVDETDDPETACTESFRQLKPFNYDLEPVEEGKKERLYKVLVVGELGAGKTSIIKRYVHQFFSQHYRATIGVDFALKVLRWDPDTVVRLQLWDIAGQERFGSMTRVYYKEAVGAFVVFDVTRSATLEAVPKWKADLDAKVALPDGRPIPTVLLANKSDQPKEGIAASREKMNDFCQQQGFSAWFETSAKDNINIDESANFLVSKILEMDKWSQEPLVADPDKVELTANGKHKGSSSSNCAC